MAKRCVTQYALEGVSHNFMTFNDFSFLVDNPYYGTNVGNIDSKISSYGDNICSIHSSDSEYLHAIDGTSVLWQKELSTSYSGYTNFNMWLNNLNTIVISNGMLTWEVSSRSVYWAVILDDEEEIGWVVARHVDNNCYVCGGHNDTGALIYYAFVRGVISPSGGAGSGYIGNSLVSNKKMVGYNVPTSSAESTKTESVNEASESPVSGKPKIGNGYARIKLIRALPDELVLYDNGQVNTDYFDTDAEIGETDAEPISKNYEVKSNYLLLEYNNWRDTTQWRGILLSFNKKTFPSVYTKVKIDLEIYAKYNSGWAAIEPVINDNQIVAKNFNGGIGVRKVSDTRYQIAGQNSFEATSRYVTDEMEILDGNNYLTFEFSGVNQYHEGYAKIYKITLTM